MKFAMFKLLGLKDRKIHDWRITTRVSLVTL